MSEFEVKGIKYKAGALSARDQFHIVRRLLPFMASIAPVFGEIKNAAAGKTVEELKQSLGMDEVAKILPPLGDAVASMSDEQADYILFGLLAVVYRQEANGLGWPPITQGRNMMYSDIDMLSMLTIAAKVLVANSGGFFDALNSVLGQQSQKPSAL